MVAVRGCILRERVDGRSSTAGDTMPGFAAVHSSKRRRKSTTWAFNSFTCMAQLRSFCVWRLWLTIIEFSCVGEGRISFHTDNTIIRIFCSAEILPFSLSPCISVPCEYNCQTSDRPHYRGCVPGLFLVRNASDWKSPVKKETTAPSCYLHLNVIEKYENNIVNGLDFQLILYLQWYWMDGEHMIERLGISQ